MKLQILVGAGLFAIGLGCGGGGSGAPPKLAAARQASPKGAQVYAKQCADCHGRDGAGIGTSPAVMGGDALGLTGSGRPQFKTAQDVFEYVQSSMPLPKSKAGSLSDGEYWAVTAYILAASGKKVPKDLGPDSASEVVVNP
jgi:mono/diheme cytochrome c family protein